MHKDEVKGSAKKLRGEVKDKVGKMTGDDKLRTDGAADKAEGSIQKGVGKAKDAVRDALKD
ncbi:CsbD family protein [Mesorhizobium sp. BR1-1-9]|uniref:CsbD family protein n=1 Tax=unclassified Mesorhizobium TaxID=325217 RepID=UPI00112D714C|nr:MULTISPECIES: CsbD family protein [unclassified Mesorhizobium]MBZ9811203.1 CsbD family protein [Mesorhizobium sp. ESP-6-2]MBZ9874656.1 CsbD family protein [Mesorhizobium sp. BR1-1-9]MBZ9942179.1 CsbD family protein [Mesorhizobium sp. BR1-1-13]TPM25782.1 CsbD family protein [Mesorhizobium sp. B2-2-2]